MLVSLLLLISLLVAILAVADVFVAGIRDVPVSVRASFDKFNYVVFCTGLLHYLCGAHVYTSNRRMELSPFLFIYSCNRYTGRHCTKGWLGQFGNELRLQIRFVFAEMPTLRLVKLGLSKLHI
jgi:hypothetical protein